MIQIIPTTVFKVGDQTFDSIKKAEDHILEAINKLLLECTDPNSWPSRKACNAFMEKLLERRQELAGLLTYEIEDQTGPFDDNSEFIGLNKMLQYPYKQ